MSGVIIRATIKFLRFGVHSNRENISLVSGTSGIKIVK